MQEVRTALHIKQIIHLLQEIIRNKQADYSARWLAGIHFKNTIGKHWKTRPGHGYAFKAAALPPHLRSVTFQPYGVSGLQPLPCGLLLSRYRPYI